MKLCVTSSAKEGIEKKFLRERGLLVDGVFI